MGHPRRSFMLQVYGYVVMPEHVHLLLSEPQRDTSSDRTAPLKPKDGLNGPPVLSEPQQDTLADALKSFEARSIAAFDWRCRAFLAKEVLRFQHSKLPAVCGKAALHSSQSGEGRVVRTSGGLGVEQFPPLRNRLRGGWRSSRNGRHENANEQREDFVQL